MSNEREFLSICGGVTPHDLQGELTYGRAKDKGDKSLEIYKFYINSLYVAITRAVKNLYVIEQRNKHQLLALLELTDFQQDVKIKQQQSSQEEWQKEARRLVARQRRTGRSHTKVYPARRNAALGGDHTRPAADPQGRSPESGSV